jgi:hypothetical protein
VIIPVFYLIVIHLNLEVVTGLQMSPDRVCAGAAVAYGMSAYIGKVNFI